MRTDTGRAPQTLMRRAGLCSAVAAALLLGACASERNSTPPPAESEARVDQSAAGTVDAAPGNAAVQVTASGTTAAAQAPATLPAPEPAREETTLGDQLAQKFTRAQRYTTVRRPVGAPPSAPSYWPGPEDRDRFAEQDDNPVKAVLTEPVSTFSVDVDTGSYALVRSRLEAGELPPADAVRLEELVNYFPWDDAPPEDREQPFAVHLQAAPAPWHADRLLLRVALKGYDLPASERKPANLVFLLDVSGSMRHADKLPLLKDAFELLTDNLRAEDRVAIVVYAGASGVVLESTPGSDAPRIRQALRELHAGGSTHGSAGIQLAYQVAREHFIEGGSNRVILATDGDFNVGTTNTRTLKDLIARQRQAGISLTTLGFGRGNFNDELLEQLAGTGNGNYAYIDSLQEARKVLGEQLGGTLETIAGDVKVQLEFNPDRVSAYRLLGYHNRLLNREDFANDKVDAGEIGLGHSVVAFYELALTGQPGQWHEPLRYGAAHGDAERARRSALAGELGEVRLRWKRPGEDSSRLITRPVTDAVVTRTFAAASDDFRFGAAVAAFAQLLRGGEYTGDLDMAAVAAIAEAARGRDALGYRAEFMRLARLGHTLARRDAGAAPAARVAGGR